MATRKIKDAKDLSTQELIYFKGHAKATFMSDGTTVEDAINQIGAGGGGITAETDPIFSASPAASITEAKKTEWDNKVDKVSGKQLSTNDYTDEDKSKLEGLDNYDDSGVKQSIKEVRESIANINPAPMVSVTYSELVELRNNGGLIAGMQYRVTDYVTTTAQENTRSAGHPFDVIVTADSNNALNEVARACCCSDFDIEKYKDAYSSTWEEKILYVGLFIFNGKEYHRYESASQDMQMLVDFNNPNILTAEDLEREYSYYFYPLYIRYKEDGYWGAWLNGKEEGETIEFKHNLAEDTYFSGTNLSAWQIWYSLDNDSKRFAWATDFGIVRDGCTFVWSGEDDDNNGYLLYPWVCINNNRMVLYTKTLLPQKGETCYDDTGVEDGVVEDIIKGKGAIYRMIDEFGNDCPYDFKNIMFKRRLNFDNGYAEFSEDGEETWVYTFAGQSYHIDNDGWSDMLDGSLESPFGHQSDENFSTFHSNIIKPYIKFLDDINDDRTKTGIRYLNDNVFLGYWEKIGSINEEDAPFYYPHCCFSNRLGNNCFSNSFNRECFFNTFGNGCYSNTFGNYCYSNTFGNGCLFNTFGNDCSYNTFGSGCHSNTFGNGCHSNSFSNNCYSNSFRDLDGFASFSFCKFDTGVRSLKIYCDDNNGSYDVKYIHVYSGVTGWVEIGSDNRKYETCYACDKSGNVHEFCIMDFKNS
jgi:hypothetical protein